MKEEKSVSYQAQNTYTAVNTRGPETRNIWLCFHGMGYLSRYFANYFKELDPLKNYMIIPQAPSKYYQGPDFKHVGASWLTRENTVEETRNVLSYVDAVWKAEPPLGNTRLIIMGYSQGVSIATRWMASRKIVCDHLILHSGGIPKELTEADFEYLSEETRVTFLYGNNDPYIDSARLEEESLQARTLFGDGVEIQEFNGVHEVNTTYFQAISENSY